MARINPHTHEEIKVERGGCIRYHGTDYTVTGVEGMTEEEIFTAIGKANGWWISGFHIVGNTAYFTEYYD